MFDLISKATNKLISHIGWVNDDAAWPSIAKENGDVTLKVQLLNQYICTVNFTALLFLAYIWLAPTFIAPKSNPTHLNKKCK